MSSNHCNRSFFVALAAAALFLTSPDAKASPPDEIETSIRSAAALINQGSMEQAGKEARRILEEYPEDHRPYLLAGFLAYHEGKPAEAARQFYSSLDIQDSTGAYRNLGLLYNDIERYHLSAIAFKRALYLEPKDARTWAILARSYDEWGLEGEAEQAFRRALELDASDAAAWRDLLTLLLENGRPGDALGILETTPDDVRLNPDIRVKAAEILRAAGRREEALQVIQELEKEGYRSASFDYLRADVYLAAEDYVQAATALERFVSAKPDEPQGWFLLARARAGLKDIEGRKQALSEYRRARDAQRSDDDQEKEESTIQLALQFLNQGNMSKAYPLLVRAGEEDPQDPDVDFGIALTALAGGTDELVDPHIRRAEEICPLNAPGWANIGNQYFARNDGANAMAAWRKALLIDPELNQTFDACTGLTGVSMINSASATFLEDPRGREVLRAINEQKFSEGAVHFEEMLRADARNRSRDLMLLTGVVSLKTGNLDKALPYLESLAGKDPPDKEAAFFAGLGLLRAGRYREGLEAWENAGLRWQIRIAE